MVLGLLPSTKFSSKNYIHLTMAYVEKSMTASVKEDNIQIISLLGMAKGCLLQNKVNFIICELKHAC